MSQNKSIAARNRSLSHLHWKIRKRQARLGLSTNLLANEVADAAGCAPSTVRRYLDGTHDTNTVVLQHLLVRLGMRVVVMQG